MQDVNRVIEAGSGLVYDTISSEANSESEFVNEEEHEELEELRLLEELELQQQQEEAEMRQRHTTERQQKLRSLQKKRLERTASKMALMQSGGSESDMSARSTGSTAPMPTPSPSVAPVAPVPALSKPVTRLSSAVSASSLNQALPPQPPAVAVQAHVAQPNVAPPRVPSPPSIPIATEQPTINSIGEFQATAPVQKVVVIQSDDQTMSRTNSMRSLGSAGSDSKFCDDGSDLPIEEQQKLAKEKKRIEALAKMQMMEQTSLLSLDSKPDPKRKGSMMSLTSSKKADSSDESEVYA